MEAMQEFAPPGFEKIREYLQETNRILKESAERHEREMKESSERHEREMKESAELNKEFKQEMKESAERHEREMKERAERYEREMKESNDKFNERLGNYINLFGEFTEYTMAPKMRDKFAGLGLYFQKTTRKIIVSDNSNGLFFEVDAMLENGDTAILVEIKTELTVDRIKKHIDRLEKMRKFSDLRGDKRIFLGAVAGVVVGDDARKYALDQGFYLIEPAGHDLCITPPNGKPKEW